MMHAVKAADISWIVEAADRFKEWLITTPGKTWTAENVQRPGIYRWTVSWIGYERLFEWLWSEPWFQDGARAFGLLALEQEGKIELLRGEEEASFFVRCPDGAVMELEQFLHGESLSIRHDPDFADFSWDPFSAIYHVLAEYDDGWSG